MNLAPGLEKPPCTRTLLDRGITGMRSRPVGLGVSLLSSKPSFQFALVTSSLVCTHPVASKLEQPEQSK